MLLKGKIALVTGGSRGLGRADALALAEAGADVVIADILIEGMKEDESLEKMGPFAVHAKKSGLVYAEKTVNEIRAMGRRSFAVKLDVTKKEEVKEGVERIKKELGPVNILVNNAATLDHTAQILDQKDEFWERDLRVNLTGAFHCTRAVWPHMKERGWGRIINMASVAGTLGGFGQASYSTTKAGIIGFTKSMALEEGRYGITCNVVCPGIIASPSFDLIPPEMKERLIKRTVFRRPGEPEDIANAIVFLASDKAKYITGIVLNVSGGIELFTF